MRSFMFWPPAANGAPCRPTSHRVRRCRAISTAGATTAPGVAQRPAGGACPRRWGATVAPRPPSSTARVRRPPKVAARAGSMPASASKAASAISSPIPKASCWPPRSMRPTSRTLTAPCRCCARSAEVSPACATSSQTASTGARNCAPPADCGPWTIEIVERPPGVKGFQLLPRRWVVERTFAWLGRCRRLAKDFEATIASATAWLLLANLRLLTRRLAKA